MTSSTTRAPLELPINDETRLTQFRTALGYPSFVILELVVFLAFWEVAVSGWRLVNPVFLPPPSAIGKALLTMIVSGELLHALAASALDFFGGYAFALVLGVIVGMLMGIFALFSRLASPIVWAIYSSPYIVFLPMFVIWFGFGPVPVMALVFTATVFPILVTTAAGVSSVEQSTTHAARVFGAGWLQRQWKVTLPSAIPFIVTGMKVAIPSGMIAMAVGEIISGPAGLGRIIAVSAATYEVDHVFAALVTLVVLSISMIQLFAALEKRAARWRFRQ